MAKKQIAKLDSAIKPFQYKGQMIVADAVDEYSTAQFSSFTNWKLVGETVGLAFNGSDATTEPWQSDAGVTVTTTVTEGTLSWTVDIMSLSEDQLEKWLAGAIVTGGTASDFWDDTAKVYKMNVSVTQTVPFGFLNDEENNFLFFPKTKITTSLNMVDNKFTIKMIITPEEIDTNYLSMSMNVAGEAYANTHKAPTT